MYVHPINRCNNYAKGIQVEKSHLMVYNLNNDKKVVNKRFNAKNHLMSRVAQEW